MLAVAATVIAATVSLLPHIGEAATTPGGTPAFAAPTRMSPGAVVPKSVTLITGDRVTLPGAGKVHVERGKARERINFLTRIQAGHTHVIPVDALPLLRAGTLDARLFDVTLLLDSHYDDASRADLPLLVTQPASANRVRPAARPATPAGARVVRDLPGNRGVLTSAGRGERATLWRSITARGSGPAVAPIWLDALRHPTLDVSVPAIGAPQAWQAGLTGDGVKVAVIDSGVDKTHPDLAGQVTAWRTFVDGEDDRDVVGHGTHVAATIAGTGAASDGLNGGVAPGATLIVAKVCAPVGCPDSAIIAGMQWAVAEQGATIVNMSLGGPDTPGTDPIEQAVQDLSEQHGALFVVAAGNDGADRSIGSPGSADAALTVGAVDDDAAVADFSSRGPRVGDSALKPDLTAPGVAIRAARSADSPGEGPYIEQSGTSMATPHVAGAAAILRQSHPDWTRAQLKAGLIASARPNAAVGIYGQGGGRVDVPSSLAQTLTADPASVSFGRPLWPHDDDTPMTKKVTYRNTGAEVVTAGLTVEATVTGHGPVPEGMFALSTDKLTVPPGGTAEVTVTADTRVASPDAFIGGYLVATMGDTLTRTPFAVEKEPESFDLTLAHTDRAGQPAQGFLTTLVNPETGIATDVGTGASEVTTRLPKGRYVVHSTLWDGDPAEPDAVFTHLVSILDLGGSRTVALDARTAEPISITLPRPDVNQIQGDLLYRVPGPTGGHVLGAIVSSFDNLYVGTAGEPVALDGFLTKVSGRWAGVGPDGAPAISPFEYNLAWGQREGAPAGFHRDVRTADLAQVDVTVAAQLPNALGSKASYSSFPELDLGIYTDTDPFPLPTSRTEFYNADEGLRWGSTFSERVASQPPAETTASSQPRSYEPGRTYAERWNGPVYGPALPDDPAYPQVAIGRLAEVIFAVPPLFSDNAGHLAYATLTSGTATLHRNGTMVGAISLIDDEPAFTVPAEPATYRLAVIAERASPFTLSTKVSCVWQFTSQHVSDNEEEIMPLAVSVVRFTPQLDAQHTAPAGARFTVPVAVQAQAGVDESTTAGRSSGANLQVEVSYDDGGTWTPAEVRDGSVVLDHPDGEGFVSLRATATDTAGNTVEQTVIRAYRYV